MSQENVEVVKIAVQHEGQAEGLAEQGMGAAGFEPATSRV